MFPTCSGELPHRRPERPSRGLSSLRYTQGCGRNRYGTSWLNKITIQRTFSETWKIVWMLCECKSARTWFLYLRIQVKFYSHVLGLPRYSDNFTSWSGSWLCILSKCYYYVIVIWSLLSLELLLKNSCQCTWRVHSFSVMSVESVDVIGLSLKALVFSRIWYILMLWAYTLWSLYQIVVKCAFI